MVSCGGTLVKIILGVFNFIGLAIGSFIIYLGVRIFQFNKTEELDQIIQANLSTGALVVTIFGSAVALLALTGFLGACCESSLLLNIYGFAVLGLLVTQCVGIYFNYKLQHEYIDQFEKGITNAISGTFNGGFTGNPQLAFALQNIQTNLKCCGWNGSGDYSNLLTVPASCCAETVSFSEPMKTCLKTSIKYTDGCKDSPVLNFVKGSLNYSSYALILVELVLILAACCLARDLTRYQPVNTFG